MCKYVCGRVCTYIWIYVYMHICIYMYTTHIYMYMVCVGMHICVQLANELEEPTCLRPTSSTGVTGGPPHLAFPWVLGIQTQVLVLAWLKRY